MSARRNAASAVLAGAAAVATAALFAVPVQAAPAKTQRPVYLYTADSAQQCLASGDAGLSGGVFDAFACASGLSGGADLTVTGTAGANDTVVFLHTFRLPQDCDATGRRGTTAKVFSWYYCQNGFAGYSLEVRG